MLDLQNIHKSFDQKSVLADVSLSVPTGSTRALIGTSGSGKTTLLRITLGLTSFDRGYVKIGGQELLSLSPKEWAEKIGYVPQDGGLFPHLSARQNITLSARLRGRPGSLIAARVEELRSIVGLDSELLDRLPQELSGGQKQRVAIMRAALLDPPVLLLDEPMGALDPLVRHALQEELKAIFKRLKKTVLLVTHDLGEAAYLADSITVLHEGRALQTGSLAELMRAPADPFVSFFLRAQRIIPENEERS
jgi:osmoprotectant transport system ATP-binding protein